MSNSRTPPAALVALSIIGGIALAYYTSIVPLWLSLAIAAASVSIGAATLKYRRIRFVPIVVALIMIGWSRTTVARHNTLVEIPKGKTSIEGTIIDMPRSTADSTPGTTCATMYVSRGALRGKKIRCYTPNNTAEKIQLGGSYLLKGKFRAIRNFNEDSHFNFVRWAQCHGIVATMRIYDGNSIESKPPTEGLPFFQRIALKSKLLRKRLLDTLAKEKIPPASRALISAIAFGERSELTKETRNTFSQSGIAHLLAISGFHLGIIYTLLSMLFFRYKRRAICSIIVVVAIWLYALFVGMPTSIVRAATMFSIYTLFATNTNATLSPNTLGVTVAIMLLTNPLMIWDVGFQLSVVAVLAIAVAYRPIYRLANGLWLYRHPIQRKVWALMVVSFAAQVGVLPLVVYYFGYFSPTFLVANLVAVPLATLLLLFVLVALVFWWIPIIRSLMIALASLSAEGLMWAANNILVSLFLLFVLFITFTPLYNFLRKKFEYENIPR